MTSNQVLALLAAAAAAVAWVGFAEHPTARTLRRAIAATLSLG